MYCDVHVCLSVRSHKTKTTRLNLTKFFVHVDCASGAICYVFSVSVDDVKFSYDAPYTAHHMYS